MEENQNDVNKTARVLVLTYSSSKGEKLIKSIKNSLKCVLHENFTFRVIYPRIRLSSKFTMVKLKNVKENHVEIISAEYTTLAKQREG